jgi:protein O-GlcNAc transferase
MDFNMDKSLLKAQALAREGRFLDAAELCKTLIKRGKGGTMARALLANCLYDAGVVHAMYGGIKAEAESLFRETLTIDPNHVDALCNLGAMLHIDERFEEALTLYQRALRVEPQNVRVLENCAKIQPNIGDLDAAATTLLKLATLAPSNSAAYLLSEALLAEKIVPDEGYPGRVRESIAKKLAAIDTSEAKVASPLRFPSTYFLLSYHGLCNKDLVTRIADIHLGAAPSLNESAPHVSTWRGPKGRIKIGIASAFFYAHSIANTSRGLVEHLDRRVCEVFLIRLGATRRDAIAESMDKSADHVVTVPNDNLAAARAAIAALSLDILFYQDIGMEPLSYLLALGRLAPVQCTSFGHPDTTGIPNIDYFISSENYEIDGAQNDYSERLILLPHAPTLSYYHRPPPPSALGRDAFGLGANEKIYLCPQTLFKIQPGMDGIFKAILQQDPLAKIVLIDSGKWGMRLALERRFARSLGGFSERVIFLKSLPYPDYLALINCSDVMLDTLNFNGQNTSLEAFSMCVPVVTMPGRMQRERHTYGVYLEMGFLELVADTPAEYAELAVRLANDAPFRAYCCGRIANSSGVLYENMQFVRNCEKAFATMIDERATAMQKRSGGCD